MMISDIAAILMAKYTGGPEPPSHDEIARLAYHFYETRGRRDGQDPDHWLGAGRGHHTPLSVAEMASTLKGTSIMNLVIIGGTGLIGSKLTTKLREHGHQAVPASP